MTSTSISTWAALADPHRRVMLELLREAPRPVGELVARTEAQRRIYALDARPLAELDAWLEPYRHRWEASLDALERHLDRTSTPTPTPTPTSISTSISTSTPTRTPPPTPTPKED